MSEALRRVADEERLVAALTNGRLVAYGRRRGSDIQPIPIDPASADIRLDCGRGTLFVSRASADTYSDVRVYPVLGAPSAAQRLDGLAIRDVFEFFILGDPEVQWLQEEARGSVHELAWTRFERSEWPLGYSWYSAEIAVSGRRSIYETPMHPREQALEDAILTRMYGVLYLLSEQHVIAFGIPTMAPLGTEVPHTVWTHDDYYIDSRKGDLLEEYVDLSSSSALKTPRWRALVLKVKERAHSGKPAHRADWVAHAELTAGERSVFEVGRDLFPNGTESLRSGDRNRRIEKALERSGSEPIGVSTIKRCFGKIAFRSRMSDSDPE